MPTAGSLVPLTVPGTHQTLTVERMNKEKETERGERWELGAVLGRPPGGRLSRGEPWLVVRNREGSDQDPEGRLGQEPPTEEPWGHGVCWRAGLQH